MCIVLILGMSRVTLRATLVMWGQQDEFLESAMAEESLNYCDDAELVSFPSATHWVLHEKPQAATTALREHLDATC